jgi:hypothetical protein
MEVAGLVIKKAFGTGSKSERQAVVLRTADGDYVLRREEGLAYRDPTLERLVGRRLRCRGTLSGYTFFMTSYEDIGDKS